MQQSEKTIAIAFDLNFRHAAEIFRGASDYIDANQLDWQLLPLNFGFESKLMQLARSGQLIGALGTFVSDRWVQGLLETGVAAINMFHFSNIESVPTVGPDDRAIGRAAAAHLQTQSAQTFAFMGANGIYSTRLLEAGFRDGLGTASCIELRPGPSLDDQVDALSKRSELIGILCSSDSDARKLIQITKRKSLQCGRDILVLGVDNDPSESIYAGIGISSFQLPIRETGYFAARALHQILIGETTQGQAHLLAPARLIPRASSLASKRAQTAQAIANSVRDSLADPDLDVALLARKVGVSRRSVELATREQFKMSPYQMIAAERLTMAQNLLRRTRLPVMEVGVRCGFIEPHHFSAWFKKRSGCAPKTYRAVNPEAALPGE